MHFVKQVGQKQFKARLHFKTDFLYQIRNAMHHWQLSQHKKLSKRQERGQILSPAVEPQ